MFLLFFTFVMRLSAVETEATLERHNRFIRPVLKMSVGYEIN